jgi:hypothetical protein
MHPNGVVECRCRLRAVAATARFDWLANLLYLYTKPFDIVVDTFASGETVS